MLSTICSIEKYFNYIGFYLWLCMCVYDIYGLGVAHAITSEDLFWESFLDFHHVGPGDGIQVFRLGGWCLYSCSHLPGPYGGLKCRLNCSLRCDSAVLCLASICNPGLNPKRRRKLRRKEGEKFKLRE